MLSVPLPRNVACPLGAYAALLIFGTFSAQPLTAQFAGVPGGDGMSASANMSEYYADIIFNVNDLTERWRRAWAANDLETLRELYHPDATMVAGDETPIRGVEAVMSRVSSMVAESGEIQTAISDFDASGRMGMVSGLFTIQVDRPTDRATLTGIHMSVYIRYKGKWKIRSQIFRVDSHDQPLPGVPTDP